MENTDASTKTNTREAGYFQQAIQRIETQCQQDELPRKTIHDINNALANITNALWLLENERELNREATQQYQSLIETELKRAQNLLGQGAYHPH